MIETFNVQKPKSHRLRNLAIVCITAGIIGGYSLRGCDYNAPEPIAKVQSIVRQELYKSVRDDLQENSKSRKKELLELSEIAVENYPTEVYQQFPSDQRTELFMYGIKEEAKQYGRTVGECISDLGETVKDYFD